LLLKRENVLRCFVVCGFSGLTLFLFPALVRGQNFFTGNIQSTESQGTLPEESPAEPESPQIGNPLSLAISQKARESGRNTEILENGATVKINEQNQSSSDSHFHILNQSRENAQNVLNNQPARTVSSSIRPAAFATENIAADSSKNNVPAGQNIEGGSLETTRTPIPPEHNGASRNNDRQSASGGVFAIFKMLINLVFVLGVLLLFVWFFRKISPKQNQILPQSVIEMLGQYPLNGRYRLFLVRFGGRLLLLAGSSERLELLVDVDEPGEIAKIIHAVKNPNPNSEGSSFQQKIKERFHNRSSVVSREER